MGLARAFLEAGASRVIASLWRVDDVATSELMAELYGGMLGPERLAPSAALRRAQLALRVRRRFRPPYFWAGFALQGDWR